MLRALRCSQSAWTEPEFAFQLRFLVLTSTCAKCNATCRWLVIWSQQDHFAVSQTLSSSYVRWVEQVFIVYCISLLFPFEISRQLRPLCNVISKLRRKSSRTSRSSVTGGRLLHIWSSSFICFSVCDCNSLGSSHSSMCSAASGQCDCLPNVDGRYFVDFYFLKCLKLSNSRKVMFYMCCWVIVYPLALESKMAWS